MLLNLHPSHRCHRLQAVLASRLAHVSRGFGAKNVPEQATIPSTSTPFAFRPYFLAKTWHIVDEFCLMASRLLLGTKAKSSPPARRTKPAASGELDEDDEEERKAGRKKRKETPPAVDFDKYEELTVDWKEFKLFWKEVHWKKSKIFVFYPLFFALVIYFVYTVWHELCKCPKLRSANPEGPVRITWDEFLQRQLNSGQIEKLIIITISFIPWSRANRHEPQQHRNAKVSNLAIKMRPDAKADDGEAFAPLYIVLKPVPNLHQLESTVRVAEDANGLVPEQRADIVVLQLNMWPLLILVGLAVYIWLWFIRNRPGARLKRLKAKRNKEKGADS